MARFVLEGNFYVDTVVMQGKQKKYPKDKFEHWHHHFEQMDQDGNGLVGKNEFFQVLKEKDPVAYINKAKCEQMWKETAQVGDANNDGTLSFEEFILACIKLGSLKPVI